MRLALIRRQYSRVGGAELYLQRLLHALAEAGHELHLFTESWPAAPKVAAVHTLEIRGSRADGPRLFAQAAQREMASGQFDCVFSLERTLKQDVYRAGDGVHRVWLQRRREFAPAWRRPFVGRGAFHRTMLELEALTFDPQNTRRIIANSEMVKREIIEHFDFPADRIQVVRNGVDVARFSGGDRTATRAQFGVKDDDYLLLFVGSGWERKGLPFLIEALREFQRASPDWLARFAEGVKRARFDAGRADARSNPRQEPDAEALERIKLLVVGKGRKPMRVPANVIWAGSRSDVENAYAAADLFVFLPIYEPSANVVCEALAAGLPVVTSALNGAGELIQENVNGTILANPADLGGVAQAIGYWRWRVGRLAGVNLATLSLDRNVAETVAVLEAAAREKSG